MKVLLSFIFLIVVITNIDCAKILGIFNIPSKSHHILGESLLKGLAGKGHEVTMLSPFTSKNLPNNYKEIVLTDVLRQKDEIMSNMMLNLRNASYATVFINSMYYVNMMEDQFFNHTITQDMIKSKKRYDIAIVMWFGNDALLALAKHLAKHTIIYSTVGSNYQITKLVKAPAPPSYVPNLMPPLPDKMSFIERIKNVFITCAFAIFDYVVTYNERTVMDKYLPNSPPLDEIYQHVSLILLNTHYSLETPRPYVPQMIQVGGLHIQEPKELSGDLKKFMDEANEGVILFSLGSNIKSSDISEEKLEAIIRCFSKVPNKVLWKFEKDDIKNLPKNVKISNWLPQRDILAHKNTKLFITHGGLLSTTEAVHNGVPMVGIPIFGDQDGNVIEGELKGYLVHVPYLDLSEETLTDAIVEVMNNPKYRNNIQLRSRIYKDQPLKPLDLAIYWVEYVLRHDGAHHLKTSALKLHWLQVYLVDVIAVVFVAIFCCVYVVRKFFKCLCSCLCKRSLKNTAKTQKKKSKVA